MPGPLSHIRVLDLSRILAGPWAAQNLADLGADVIKVERPGVGDDTRGWGPPWMKDAKGGETRESAYLISTNRNKRSITLDIGKPEGQAIVRQLAAKCDVLIENYKVGTLKRYGLCYEDLRQINPRLIYCSITGFGQDGPDAHLPGYDFIFQGIGGLMSVTGERDGEPGAGPMKAGVAVTDFATGMYASLSICAALLHAERTGLGQHIDLALLDSSIALISTPATTYLSAGQIPRRYGNAHPQVVPYQAFTTSDGHIILAIGNDGQFEQFCEIAGRPELARDPLFEKNTDRVVNRSRLVPIVADILKTRPSIEWLTQLEAVGVPCGPINNMKEVFENRQVRHRKLRVDIPHKLGGNVSLVGSPMRLSLTPVEYRFPPPVLGEHTESILKELLEKNDDEIESLRKAGIV